MKRNIISLIFALIIATNVFAQVSINNDNSAPESSAMLDIKSTDKGILIPRMTTVQRNLINSPALGLLIFDTDTESFWFKESIGWVELGGNGSSDEISDTDSDTRIQVEANSDEDRIRFDMGGIEYFVMDSGRIHVKNTGNSVFLGENAGQNDDLTNNRNIFIGKEAGKFNTNGDDNIGIGNSSLKDNQVGRWNIAIGREALTKNLGNENIALGVQALIKNTSGESNIALGRASLFKNLTGDLNIAIGRGALPNNTTGSHNIGLGQFSLEKNTAGSNNIAIGYDSGQKNVNGFSNILIGRGAGIGNIAHNKNNNVMIGVYSGKNNQGDGNVFLGYQSGYNEAGDNKLYIENTSSATPLIYGEFDNDIVEINGDLTITDSLNTKNLIVYDEIKFGKSLGPALPPPYYPVANDVKNIMVSGKIGFNGNPNSTISSTYIDTNTANTKKLSTGRYQVYFDSGTFNQAPIVTVTAFHQIGNTNRYAVLESVSSTHFIVEIRNNNGNLKDAPFNFIAIGKRN